jgi:hypothetical protein
MADTKPSAFTADSTPDDADTIPYIDLDGGGAGVHLNRRLTFSDLTTYIESRARQHNAAVATQVTGAVDVYVTNSNVAIPNTRLQAKTKMRWDLSITKAAAGTGTPTFNIRVGTAGAIGDTSRCLFTWPAANTAVADEMKVEIMATFRTIGSGTTAVIEGQLIAQHELTTTGFGGTGLGANIIINTTGGGFDSTVSNLIAGLSVNPGTAGAWSIRQCQAIVENLA